MKDTSSARLEEFYSICKWYVGDDEDALGSVLEVDQMQQILAVEDRQVRVGYDALAHNLGLELLDSVELERVLVHFPPVRIDQVVDDFLSKGLRNLPVPFEPFRQKPHLVPTSPHPYSSSSRRVFLLRKMMYICSMTNAMTIVDKMISTIT